MSFLNTEQTYSLSGIAAGSGNIWLNANPSFNQIRNSGGIVNIVAPILVKDILIVPASGQYTAASASGVVLAVNHATSGQFAQLSGQELFRFDGASHSGLGTGNLTAVPPSLNKLDFLARSGIVTLNSGTHVYDIIVLYANAQA